MKKTLLTVSLCLILAISSMPAESIFAILKEEITEQEQVELNQNEVSIEEQEQSDGKSTEENIELDEENIEDEIEGTSETDSEKEVNENELIESVDVSEDEKEKDTTIEKTELKEEIIDITEEPTPKVSIQSGEVHVNTVEKFAEAFENQKVTKIILDNDMSKNAMPIEPLDRKSGKDLVIEGSKNYDSKKSNKGVEEDHMNKINLEIDMDSIDTDDAFLIRSATNLKLDDICFSVSLINLVNANGINKLTGIKLVESDISIGNFSFDLAKIENNHDKIDNFSIIQIPSSNKFDFNRVRTSFNEFMSYISINIGTDIKNIGNMAFIELIATEDSVNPYKIVLKQLPFFSLHGNINDEYLSDYSTVRDKITMFNFKNLKRDVNISINNKSLIDVFYSKYIENRPYGSLLQESHKLFGFSINELSFSKNLKSSYENAISHLTYFEMSDHNLSLETNSFLRKGDDSYYNNYELELGNVPSINNINAGNYKVLADHVIPFKGINKITVCLPRDNSLGYNARRNELRVNLGQNVKLNELRILGDSMVQIGNMRTTLSEGETSINDINRIEVNDLNGSLSGVIRDRLEINAPTMIDVLDMEKIKNHTVRIHSNDILQFKEVLNTNNLRYVFTNSRGLLFFNSFNSNKDSELEYYNNLKFIAKIREINQISSGNTSGVIHLEQSKQISQNSEAMSMERAWESIIEKLNYGKNVETNERTLLLMESDKLSFSDSLAFSMRSYIADIYHGGKGKKLSDNMIKAKTGLQSAFEINNLSKDLKLNLNEFIMNYSDANYLRPSKISTSGDLKIKSRKTMVTGNAYGTGDLLEVAAENTEIKMSSLEIGNTYKPLLLSSSLSIVKFTNNSGIAGKISFELENLNNKDSFINVAYYDHLNDNFSKKDVTPLIKTGYSKTNIFLKDVSHLYIDLKGAKMNTEGLFMDSSNTPIFNGFPYVVENIDKVANIIEADGDVNVRLENSHVTANNVIFDVGENDFNISSNKSSLEMKLDDKIEMEDISILSGNNINVSLLEASVLDLQSTKVIDNRLIKVTEDAIIESDLNKIQAWKLKDELSHSSEEEGSKINGKNLSSTNENTSDNLKKYLESEGGGLTNHYRVRFDYAFPYRIEGQNNGMSLRELIKLDGLDSEGVFNKLNMKVVDRRIHRLLTFDELKTRDFTITLQESNDSNLYPITLVEDKGQYVLKLKIEDGKNELTEEKRLIVLDNDVVVVGPEKDYVIGADHVDVSKNEWDKDKLLEFANAQSFELSSGEPAKTIINKYPELKNHDTEKYEFGKSILAVEGNKVDTEIDVRVWDYENVVSTRDTVIVANNFSLYTYQFENDPMSDQEILKHSDAKGYLKDSEKGLERKGVKVDQNKKVPKIKGNYPINLKVDCSQTPD